MPLEKVSVTTAVTTCNYARRFGRMTLDDIYRALANACAITCHYIAHCTPSSFLSWDRPFSLRLFVTCLRTFLSIFIFFICKYKRLLFLNVFVYLSQRSGLYTLTFFKSHVGCISVFFEAKVLLNMSASASGPLLDHTIGDALFWQTLFSQLRICPEVSPISVVELDAGHGHVLGLVSKHPNCKWFGLIPRKSRSRVELLKNLVSDAVVSGMAAVKNEAAASRETHHTKIVTQLMTIWADNAIQALP